MPDFVFPINKIDRVKSEKKGFYTSLKIPNVYSEAIPYNTILRIKSEVNTGAPEG